VQRIEPTTTIEELVESVPGVVSYLIHQGLPCIVCGQPLWGTLEEMAREKGRSDEEIERLIIDMNLKLDPGGPR
jgi:Ni,Fe-hydrogenase I small subunit